MRLKRMAYVITGLIVLSLTAGLGGAVAAEGDWPVLGRTPTHTNFVPEEATAPYSVHWMYYAQPNPGSPTSPIVAGGFIYLSIDRFIYRLELETGALQGRVAIPAKIGATPVVDSGRLYVPADDGFLYSLDAGTGDIQWKFAARRSVRGTPVVVDGVIYVGANDNYLYALDAVTGRELWKTLAEGPIVAAPTVHRGVVYFPSVDARVYAVDARTGESRWIVQMPSPYLVTPIVTNGNRLLVATRNEIYFMSMWGRRSLPPFTLGDAITGPLALDADTVYAASVDHFVYAVNANTGGLRWKYDAGSAVTSGPIVAGNVVFCVAGGGGVIALDTKTGDLLWRYRTNPPNLVPWSGAYSQGVGSPLYVNGSLLTFSDDGNLYCFRHDAPDVTGPMVANLSPQPQSLVRGWPPISLVASTFDDGSGLDDRGDSLRLAFDGVPVPMRYDPRTGTCWYTIPSSVPEVPLADGPHTVTFGARDWRGNTTVFEWNFNTTRGPGAAAAISTAVPPGSPF